MTEHRSAQAEAEKETQEDETRLSASDERLVAAMRAGLDSGERTAAQRAAFRAGVEERLERRSRFGGQPLVLAASALAAALILWFTVPDLQHAGDGSDSAPVVAESAGLLAYAYYETDYLANSEAEGDFLSDEYQAISAAFDVP